MCDGMVRQPPPGYAATRHEPHLATVGATPPVTAAPADAVRCACASFCCPGGEHRAGANIARGLTAPPAIFC
eukprot:scaffold3587_cov109-Isochrysis_galbana.AAC.5